MNTSRLQSNHIIDWNMLICSVLLMLVLPPFIGVPLAVFHCYRKQFAQKKDYYVYFVCISLYIASINATKLPNGDQLAYASAFSNVPTEGFWGSLTNIYGKDAYYGKRSNISGEFMNGVYNYVGYYVTFGYYPLFICIYTFIEMMLVFMGFYHFCQKIKNNHIPLITGPILLVFFYMYFNMMVQIQKQFMAQAIMMYVIGCYAQYGKMSRRLWIISAVSLFTHASMILFVFFLALKRLRSQLSLKSFLTISVLFGALIVWGPSLIGSSVQDIDESTSAMSYGLKRVALSEKANDGLSIDFTHPRTLVVLVPILWVMYKKLWKERNTLNVAEQFILNIVFLLTITTFVMFNQPLAQYRYFLMTYMFIPFFFIFISNQIALRNQILRLLAFLSMTTFYLFFESIPWKYAPLSHIMIMPPGWLVFYNYYGL